MIVNYNGHGAETGWTEEQILTINDIDKLSNLKNLPVMLTATCQFGRYDDPNQVSGAELALLSNRGGAIALLTTTTSRLSKYKLFNQTKHSIKMYFLAIHRQRNA